MNEHDYPSSPAYYQQNGADCRNHVTPEYWRDSAFVHLFRAGRKSGETVAEALTNAFFCLALWFRSQGLQVPYYSSELARLRGELDAYRDAYRTESREGAQLAGDLRAENARLRAELAALRPDGAPLESTPPTPATSADEWTDDELAEWLDANRGESHGHNLAGYGAGRVWTTKGNTVPAVQFYSRPRKWYVRPHQESLTATEAARILNATKPADPLAELLTIETDEGLERWLKSNPHRTRTPAVLVRAFDRGSDLAKAGWYVQDLGVAMTARDAARTLHRILTGSAA